MLPMMDVSICKGNPNDRLVDYLVYYCYIWTRKIELAFRAVDRGDYILRTHAYVSYAWKHGNIHLSAPTIYAKVLEMLDLHPGMSFLNIGSGTGYLSTVAGLLLKQHGTNHGIELHEDCLKYAYQCLERFKKSQALDKFGFCEPVFTQGNCLNLTPDRQYDRVYCGANCPEQYVEFMKKFVKVNGLIVMPVKDEIVRLERKSATEWDEETILSVRFETLVVPTPEQQTVCHLPEYTPLSLQELCRGVVRDCLQKRIWGTHQKIKTKYRIHLTHEQSYKSELVFNQPTGLYRTILYEPDKAAATNKNKSIPSSFIDEEDSPLHAPSITVIHVDDAAFTAYMRKNISRLPLPHPLKLYINYNRDVEDKCCYF